MAQPNIIFIHVDEMRFPMHLPANAPTPDAFLAKYMPNLYSLWTKGVKFKRYFTAAADCTPGRGTFVTGLYAYQTGLFLTRESTSNPYATKQPQPALHPDFPTYGKVLREARPGYTIRDALHRQVASVEQSGGTQRSGRCNLPGRIRF
jgi:uncharacterized sulfatase